MILPWKQVTWSDWLLQDYNLSRVGSTMAEGGSGGSGAAPDTGHTSGGQPTAPNSTGLLPLSPPKSEVDDSPLQKSMDKNKECKYRFVSFSQVRGYCLLCCDADVSEVCIAFHIHSRRYVKQAKNNSEATNVKKGGSAFLLYVGDLPYSRCHILEGLFCYSHIDHSFQIFWQSRYVFLHFIVYWIYV
jgi:hypothetical protein